MFTVNFISFLRPAALLICGISSAQSSWQDFQPTEYERRDVTKVLTLNCIELTSDNIKRLGVWLRGNNSGEAKKEIRNLIYEKNLLELGTIHTQQFNDERDRLHKAELDRMVVELSQAHVLELERLEQVRHKMVADKVRELEKEKQAHHEETMRLQKDQAKQHEKEFKNLSFERTKVLEDLRKEFQKEKERLQELYQVDFIQLEEEHKKTLISIKAEFQEDLKKNKKKFDEQEKALNEFYISELHDQNTTLNKEDQERYELLEKDLEKKKERLSQCLLAKYNEKKQRNIQEYKAEMEKEKKKLDEKLKGYEEAYKEWFIKKIQQQEIIKKQQINDERVAWEKQQIIALENSLAQHKEPAFASQGKIFLGSPRMKIGLMWLLESQFYKHFSSK